MLLEYISQILSAVGNIFARQEEHIRSITEYKPHSHYEEENGINNSGNTLGTRI